MDGSAPRSILQAPTAAGSKLPTPKSISANTVEEYARTYSKRIFSDWGLLKAILDRHEATIRKRWAKKTKTKRIEVLVTAWPAMSATHRPDFAAFRRETDQECEACTKFRDAYLWPYINLEDLSTPKTLLLFLNARAQTSPDIFARADIDAAHLGLASKAIVPRFLDNHTMMFNGRKAPETYGELLSWDDDDSDFDWLATGHGMNPGEGLLVLEAQARVYKFLVDCCKMIMHEIPTEQLSSGPVEPPVEPIRENSDGINSLLVMRTEAPYRAPTAMDLGRVESLIAAKKEAAEHHIWTMREDPGYFSRLITDYKSHRQETMEDTDGRSHPLLLPGHEETFWYRVIGDVVGTAHVQLEFWSELHGQVQKLRELKEKYAEQICTGSELPEEYLIALLRFQHYLNHAAKGPKTQLKKYGPSSTPLRRFYNRLPAEDSDRIVLKGNSVKPTETERNLLWLLEAFWDDGHRLSLIGMTDTVDELERLIQSDMQAKSLISPLIADALSDLAVFTEALRHLSLYQPWAQTFEDEKAEREESIKAEFIVTTKHWSLVLTALYGSSQAQITQLGIPDGKFYYPVEKRRTKEVVEALTMAEHNLDAFWLAVDRNMRVDIGTDLQRTALWKLLAQSRMLERTAEWMEPAKDKEYAAQVEGPLFRPLSELFFELDHTSHNTPKESAEWKGAQKFAVNPRALKVFRSLFYTPSRGGTPGEVTWPDFLHAMVAVGFGPEKLYGSVWQFNPERLKVGNSIQLHEPRPTGKLQYQKAREIGRRLNHAYGWVGSMFVPA